MVKRTTRQVVSDTFWGLVFAAFVWGTIGCVISSFFGAKEEREERARLSFRDVSQNNTHSPGSFPGEVC
jgi:hypothetical protein